MNIRLHDARTVALEFPYSPATVARVKALPGSMWDKDAKAWYAPLCHLRRLADAFPGATIDRAAIDARLDLWRRWIRQYNACGVWFAYDVDCVTVAPTGPGVSPVFEEWVAERSEILSQFLGDQVEPPTRRTVPAWEAEPTHGDRLIWTGIQNAAKAEDRKAEIVERARGKRGAGQTGQMELLEDER